MALFTFLFWTKITFLVKFRAKNQGYPTKMKLGIYTNLNMLNLMVMFAFSVLDVKHISCAKLVQKN